MSNTPATEEIILGPEQQNAMLAFEQWLDDFNEGQAPRPFFVLQGYAGTGKSFAVAQMMETLKLTPHYMTYTGKAALVLRRYASIPATTIHSKIYRLKSVSDEVFRDLYDARDNSQDPEEIHKINLEIKELMQPKFELNPDAFEDSDINAIVLDECSMVDANMLQDIASFGLPIIALGDAGQLPPVKGTGALFNGLPDAELTEIRRQAEGSPIIQWSMLARRGHPLPPTDTTTWKTDEVSKIPYALAQREMKDLFDNHDIAICWKNKTRQNLNLLRRRQLGFSGTFPQEGETLQITKNDKHLGLFNGQFAKVVRVGEIMDTYIELDILPEDSDTDEPVTIKCLRACFEVYHDKDAFDKLRSWDYVGTQQADFGYAITCHKAQGSQWDRVLVFEENCFMWKDAVEDRKRWIYTAITRAAKKLTVIVGKV